MSHFRNAISRSIQFLLIACALHALPAHARNNFDAQVSSEAQGSSDAQVSSGAQNSVQALNVSSTADGNIVLEVTLKNQLAAPPGHFAATSPARLVFDFPGTSNGLGRAVQEVNQGDVRSINIVQAGARTRLVVNLGKMMSYSSKIAGNSFVVTLSSLSTEPQTSHFAEPMPSVAGHNLRDVDFHRGKNGEGRVEIALSDPGTGIDIRQEGSKIIVDFIKTNAPHSLLRKLDVTDFATPVESVDTFVQGENVRMVISPKGRWDQSAYQTDNKFVVEVKPKPPEERLKPAEKPVYSGKILTLNFQNISVREALGVIADFTGLNIVISDTVSGNLTLRLKDVPWDQALDIILQTKGLSMEKTGNVVRVAPAEEMASQKKVIATEQNDIAELEPLRTESFVLSYQRGEDIVALISNEKQRILSKRGSAVVDKHTNLLFVQDIPGRLEDVRALIKQIDVPVRQVMIEARFVSAKETFTRTLGGRLGFANATTGAGFHAGGGQLGNATGNVNLPGASSGTGGLTFSLFNPANTKTLQLELAATEADGTSKNIASPRVVTADNNPANISAGTEIPYQVSTSSGATAIAFVNALLSLTVQPQITPDDHVNMKLIVNQDTVGAIYSNVPSIDTKKVTTQVLVDNGGTVVIGGIYTKDTSTAVTKVPLLGDIPIIGWLFKSDTVTDNKDELLIFISPKIIKSSLSLN